MIMLMMMLVDVAIHIMKLVYFGVDNIIIFRGLKTSVIMQMT
jgi:hypothetical protein